MVLASLAMLAACGSKPEQKEIENEDIPQSEGTYNLEGKRLTRFLDSFEYDTDYSYTRVHEFIVQGEEADAYQPAYITIPDDCEATKAVLVSNRGEETSRQVYGKGKTAIYNLIPGRTYTYTLFSADGKALKTAFFETTGRVRALKTSKYLHNFRDIGGWEGLNGKHIKYGYLIRGSEVKTGTDDLSRYELADYEFLINQIGINYDMDFRTDEGAGYFYESPLGIEFIRIPLSAYASVITKKERQEAYKQSILQFIENTKAGKCTYMHCQGGADRTGTLVFFIEGLLGVSESNLAKDYEITTFYYHKERNDEERYKTMISELMSRYSKGGSLSDAIYNCAKGMGITDSDIEELRKLMLE